MKVLKTRSFQYPSETEGSRVAASARAETNQLSKAKKRRLRELGMKLAYRKAEAESRLAGPANISAPTFPAHEQEKPSPKWASPEYVASGF